MALQETDTMKKAVIFTALAGAAGAALLGLSAQGQSMTAAGAVTQVSIPEKADNFRLTDHLSKSHELRYFKNAAAIVIVTHASGSEHVRAAAPAIEALKAEYAARGVQFFYLNSTPGDTREGIAADAEAAGITVPVLIDSTQLIGDSLGVSRTAQAFVIDPKTWKIVYSGPVDDRFADKKVKAAAAPRQAYLANALSDMAAGRAIRTVSAELKSPEIAFPDRARRDGFAKISYAKDVAPILEANCVSCHTSGGIAPFAMSSYETVRGFAPMIREALRTDRMPPYHADPHVGSFRNDGNLTTDEMKTLVRWIEAGAPRGEGDDPLKAHVRAAPEWELGEPDLVLTLPAFTIPASGIVEYQNPVLENPLKEGRWLRASTINVGDRQAVHHLLSPVGGYAVGAESTVYSENTGVWVEPGQKLRFQLHYTPYGKETTDVTRIGLYFHDAAPKYVRRSVVIANAGIEIPPHAARHEETAYITFPEDAILYSVFPHAHYRGENMAVSIQKPGQKEELVLSLPKYDFNWQRGYEFSTPLDIPAGTRVITRYQYDNSAANPANPDPTIRVTWGEQSHEEMQYTAMGFRWKDETSSNLKPDYMNRLNASRTIGIMDVNLNGVVEKNEARGRMGQAIKANFDRLDTDKSGSLSETELAAVTQMMNRRIEEAAAQQSVGQ
jgi:hypothetical protein